MSGLPDFRPGWYGNPLFDTDDPEPSINSTEVAARRGRNSKNSDQDQIQCPNCGDEYGNLPLHLAGCDAGGDD